eukprot:GHVR01078804.1.p1 GENE.GHVR01078804.1~~GHVR01078804.1.p1  ORF type:complete len:178 (+),score=56.03 GHVR01078804.1:17-550(+)
MESENLIEALDNLIGDGVIGPDVCVDTMVEGAINEGVDVINQNNNKENMEENLSTRPVDTRGSVKGSVCNVKGSVCSVNVEDSVKVDGTSVKGDDFTCDDVPCDGSTTVFPYDTKIMSCNNDDVILSGVLADDADVIEFKVLPGDDIFRIFMDPDVMIPLFAAFLMITLVHHIIPGF